MDHNQFHMFNDIVAPLKRFFYFNNITVGKQCPIISLDQTLYNYKLVGHQALDKMMEELRDISKSVRTDTNTSVVSAA